MGITWGSTDLAQRTATPDYAAPCDGDTDEPDTSGPRELTESEQREIDALVAEKVMGWTKTYPDIAWCWTTPAGKRTVSGYACYGCFRPSTDIAAAWEVAEKVVERPRNLAEGERVLQFARWWRDTPLWDMHASEAAHAICLAALKACGVDTAAIAGGR